MTIIELYRQELRKAIRDYPTEYAYGLDQVETVAVHMGFAFKLGTYNKDSRAIKSMCKVLKIKHTYKALNEIFSKGLNVDFVKQAATI